MMSQLDASYRRVRLRDVSLNVAEVGEGPPLVLLHGWPQHGWMWRKLLAPLAAEYRVIAPDLRGFGRSDAPPGGYLKRTLAADVLELLDALGIDRARVLGHDWGGWVSWLLALEHSDRIERFATLDITAPWPGKRSPARALGLAAFSSYQVIVASPVTGMRALRSRGFIHRVIRAGSGSKIEWSDEELGAYAEQFHQPGVAEASVALYRTWLTRELPQLILGTYAPKELTVPALVIMGERSPLRRAVGMPEPRAMMRVEETPGAGHFLAEEAPEEVLAEVLPFFRQRSSVPHRDGGSIIGSHPKPPYTREVD